MWWLLSGLHPGRPGHGWRDTRCSELVSNPWLLLGKGRQEQNTWAGQLNVRMWAEGRGSPGVELCPGLRWGWLRTERGRVAGGEGRNEYFPKPKADFTKEGEILYSLHPSSHLG